MIELDRVSKAYRVYQRKSDWLKERILRRPLHQTKAAVRDVSLSVGQGEVLGIIGRNGAGKSTLLKLIMGVALPDTGEVRVSGRVTGLLELGTGFNADLSGADNIDFNATLLGMTPEEIAARRADIVAFSELGAAIDDPLRTYSSGMGMRLAFSIAIHADPACFVVDEALSVGDIHFQQKCMRRIRAFKENGGSIVFVSHDVNSVKVLCDRAALLEQGEVVAVGDPDFAANRYNRLIARMDDETVQVGAPLPAAPAGPASGGTAADGTAADGTGGANGYGTGEAVIEAVEVKGDESGGAILSAGEMATIDVKARAREAISGATLGVMIRDRFGQDVFGTNTHYLGNPVDITAGETLTFRFRCPMNLGPGAYSLTVALHRDNNHLETCYHWCDNLGAFEIAGFHGPRFQGLCRLEPVFSVERAEQADV
jgi:lipopolysaccharide transport system ATP-binding protein